MTETQAKVVKAMAENQLNMTRAAKALHYHKTNIYKHVIRVLDQTGKDMRDFYDMTQLLREAEVVLGTARGKRYASLMEPDMQAFTDEEEWMRFLSEVKAEIARRDANVDRE